MDEPGNKTLEFQRKLALAQVNERFAISDSVKQLQVMMGQVTKGDGGFTAQNVQAACNCANQINTTIKTAIMAAKFLSEK